jgi:putative transposase
VSAFIESQKAAGLAVELVCRTLGVSRSAHYQRRSGHRSPRAIRDEQLVTTIGRLHEANFCAYGYRKMHLALRRAGIEDVGRDRVKRLMREHGIRGAKRRGKPWRTTVPDPEAARRPDLVERDFTATGPDRLYVADFTYLRCWEGLVFFAFVIDVYSRRVVGWQLTAHMRASLVCDALRMAVSTRPRHGADVQLIHHSDRGSQTRFNRSLQHRLFRPMLVVGFVGGDLLVGVPEPRSGEAGSGVV